MNMSRKLTSLMLAAAYTNRKGEKEASCKVGIPNGVLYIVNRDYLVDEEKGAVNIFCRFGDSTSGMPDAHTLSVSIGRDLPQVEDF
jgi:hypothetical protein